MKSKKGIELGFNWIFAISVGIVILFLSIYAATRFVSTGEKFRYTEGAAEIVNLFSSLEGRFASKKPAEINFREDAKLYFDCDELSNRPFGKQTVQIDDGGKISIKTNYVFSENEIEGKNLYVFSKPFSLGYNVGDLIILSMENYCFVDSIDEIKDEIIDLNLNNIKFVDDVSDCEEGSISVCFNNGNCNIKVVGNYESGKVIKNENEVYYTGNLLFGAIFSSADIYECNVKRLTSRFKELALIYRDKIKIIETRGCESDIDIKLDLAREFEINSSENLIILMENVKEIDEINKRQQDGCEVW